jgi:hypothetical protein
MKVSIAHFQSLVAVDNFISGSSELLSETNSTRNSDNRLTIRAVLQNRSKISGQRPDFELLRSFQRASNDLLQQTLDHAYKRSSDLVVVRGLALSDEALDTVERFSVTATIVILSPMDTDIRSLLADRHVSMEKDTPIADGLAWLAWVQGPNQRSAHILSHDKEIAFYENQEVILRVFVDAQLGESLHLSFPALNQAITSYSCFGIRAQVKALDPSKSVSVDNKYMDNVQRVLHFDLTQQQSKIENRLEEVLIVPKGLDPVLTVAAEEIATGAVNVGTNKRLNQLRSKVSAPAVVRNLAAELLSRIDNSPIGNQPNVLILHERIYSAEECLYVHLKRLRDVMEKAEPLDEPGLIAVNERRHELVPLVHPVLLDPQDLPESTDSAYDWAFYAVLGPFDTAKAKASLSRQLEVLRFLANTRDPDLELVYRATTRIDPVTDLPNTTFEIIVRYLRKGARGSTRRSARALGLMLQAVFTDVYSFKYGNRRPVLPRSQWIKQDTASSESVRLFPAHAIDRWPDWGLFLTLAHEAASETSLEMILTTVAEPAQEEPLQDGAVAHEFFDSPTDVSRMLKIQAQLTAGPEYIELFDGVIRGQFGMTDDIDEQPLLRPRSALARFHPPFADIPTYGTPPPLRLQIEGAAFPAVGVELGKVEIRLSTTGRIEIARLADRDRLRHIYVLGRTGTGKTNLLKRLVEQDVRRDGQGVTVIDPHGELADHALSQVPWSRLDNGEVVWLDFSTRDYLPVLNPFYRGMSPIERDRTIQTILKLLRERVYHEFTGPRFEELIRICLVTILNDRFPGIPSLVQVPRLLSDHTYRTSIIKQLNDANISARWRFHDSQRGDRDYNSTLDWAVSKFTDLLEDETLRLTLSGDVRTVDFEHILSEGKILLVKLPEGVVGPDAAEFIGGLIVAQLRLAAFRVGSEDLAARGRCHFVYLDEFQKFTTTDIARVVAEARKFGLGFVLAHQNLEQLRDFSRYSGQSDRSLLAAILGNVGNTVVFRAGALDSTQMEQHLSLESGSLLRLERFEAVASVLVDGRDVGPFTLSPKLVSSSANPRNLARIVELMSKPDGVWRRIEDLNAQAVPAGGDLLSAEPSSKAVSKGRVSETEGGFLDEWLAKRRMKSRVPESRRFVPKLPVSAEELVDYSTILDTWVARQRGGVSHPSSESSGSPGVTP